MVKVNKEAHIPLMTYDLGYEETILQMIKSLDCLDKVVECVFSHVKGKINSQKSEIAKLNDNLNNIADKVKRLSTIKKSVQVYSSSKYPAAHCHKDYEYSYDFDVKSDIVDNIEVTHQICVSRYRSDKVKFYSVNNPQEKLYTNNNIFQKKGLGSLPDDIKYLNSLLLFNSNENLYKNYVLSNPYKVNNNHNIMTKLEVENVENINRPVFSLPLDDTDNQFNYSYTPVSEEIPSIDVPADLPDLPGIAGDVQVFEEEKYIDSSIIMKPSSIVDLPSFDELDNLKNDEIIPDDSTNTVQESVEPKLQEEITVATTQIKTDYIEDINKPIKTDHKNVNKTFSENINTHSVLMDEIRNAGGLQKAKLRSVNNREADKNEILPAGGGLMADLHRKLAMRRKGISGNNKQNDVGIEGAMYRISSTMLPLDRESESEADGDDDTEGDWDD